MTKRMLIDASHAEETRVVLLDGNRIEDYDIEASTRRQLKGNIYLAKVVRVEPSLQAAFVEYGGNRHGFLAFSEIHPDYYQIPVADRQRLLEMQEAEAREEEEEEERAAARRVEDDSDDRDLEGEDAVDSTVQAGYALQADPEAALDKVPEPDRVAQAAAIAVQARVAPEEAREEFPTETPGPAAQTGIAATSESDADASGGADSLAASEAIGADLAPEAVEPAAKMAERPMLEPASPTEAEEILEGTLTGEVSSPDSAGGLESAEADSADARPAPELVGGEGDDRRERRSPPRFLRNYKIQEVIRRRQILLVQVVKEERGTKGAALTTYVSLAGRFSVLMPNSPRGGGISRKITSAADRRRLKEVMTELGLPRGMGLIVRTAGANRPKAEIMRDCEYLLTQWDQIRDLTMRSIAPALIYEEANLIKRAMRDLYSRDVEEVLVEGEGGWKAARDFMRMLMPDAARKVQLWRDAQPLFTKANVEQQLDSMLAPTVQLRSGGYLVINQAEALVAIDVNSGRSTRERGIEETALRTNLEAAEEVARQLRLRDLAGLIVIDFIDMESRRHNAMVERRLKEALRNDRARIQVGSISHFGLLEMSRQRLRPSLAETNFVACPHCGGLGHVRSVESCALHVLRAVEEEGARRRASEILVHCAGDVALYLLNYKRARLAEIEARFAMHVTFASDATLLGAQVRVDRLRAQQIADVSIPISQVAPPEIVEDEPVEDSAPEEAEPVAAAEASAEAASDEADGRRRRRRRRNRGRVRPEGGELDAAPSLDGAEDDAVDEAEQAAPDEGETLEQRPAVTTEAAVHEAVEIVVGEQPAEAAAEAARDEVQDDKTDEPAKRRRGRRGGRRRRREDEADAPPAETDVPVYVGPTPADPFGGAFDIFDAFERAEEQWAARAEAPTSALTPSLGSGAEPPGAAEAPLAEPVAQHKIAEADASEQQPLNGRQSPELLEPVESDAGELDDADPLPTVSAPHIADGQTTEPEHDELSDGTPAVLPVLVTSDDAPSVPKRGWWRR